MYSKTFEFSITDASNHKLTKDEANEALENLGKSLAIFQDQLSKLNKIIKKYDNPDLKSPEIRDYFFNFLDINAFNTSLQTALDNLIREHETELDGVLDWKISRVNVTKYQWWNVLVKLNSFEHLPNNSDEWYSTAVGILQLSPRSQSLIAFLILKSENMSIAGKMILELIIEELSVHGERMTNPLKNMIEFEMDYIFKYHVDPLDAEDFNVLNFPALNLLHIFNDDLYPKSRLNWKYFILNLDGVHPNAKDDFFESFNSHLLRGKDIKSSVFNKLSSKLLVPSSIQNLQHEIGNMYRAYLAMIRGRLQAQRQTS